MMFTADKVERFESMVEFSICCLFNKPTHQAVKYWVVHMKTSQNANFGTAPNISGLLNTGFAGTYSAMFFRDSDQKNNYEVYKTGQFTVPVEN